MLSTLRLPRIKRGTKEPSQVWTWCRSPALFPVAPELHELVGGKAVEVNRGAAFDRYKLRHLHRYNVAAVPAVGDPDVLGVARYRVGEVIEVAEHPRPVGMAEQWPERRTRWPVSTQYTCAVIGQYPKAQRHRHTCCLVACNAIGLQVMLQLKNDGGCFGLLPENAIGYTWVIPLPNQKILPLPDVITPASDSEYIHVYCILYIFKSSI